jgi:formylglycine-generating enzyme required for sulfatase activity
VDSYQAMGASPYGVWNMAGNVSEWTSNLNMAYPYQVDDGREDLASADCCRAIRGGTWGNRPDDVRAASRGAGSLHGWGIDLGFRVAVSPGL